MFNPVAVFFVLILFVYLWKIRQPWYIIIMGGEILAFLVFHEDGGALCESVMVRECEREVHIEAPRGSHQALLSQSIPHRRSRCPQCHLKHQCCTKLHMKRVIRCVIWLSHLTRGEWIEVDSFSTPSALI